MRYNCAYKSKIVNGSRGYSTFYSNVTDPTDDAAFVQLRNLINANMANNAKLQLSMVVDDVFDDEIELPGQAELVDEKEVTFYLGNREDKSVFASFVISHVAMGLDIITPFTSLVEGEDEITGSTSPFRDRNGVQLNKVIKAFEVVKNVTEGGTSV